MAATVVAVPAPVIEVPVVAPPLVDAAAVDDVAPAEVVAAVEATLFVRKRKYMCVRAQWSLKLIAAM